MAQVAYHVQLTWLLVTAVTPDRLESASLDAGRLARTRPQNSHTQRRPASDYCESAQRK